MKNIKQIVKILTGLMVLQIVWANPGKAQSLDSLKFVWENKSLPDTSRASALINLISYGYVDQKPDSGIYYARILDEFAEKRVLSKYKGYALWIMGRCYKTKGRFDEAKQYLDESLVVFKETDCPSCIDRVISDLADICTDHGDIEQAEAYLLQRLAFRESSGSEMDICHALLSLSEFYGENQKLNSAISYRKRVVQKYVLAGDSIEVAGNLDWIALYFEKQGKVDSAIFYRLEITKLLQAMGLTNTFLISNYQRLIEDYAQINDLLKVTEYANLALSICKDMNDSLRFINVSVQTGRGFYQKEFYSRAIDYYFKGESFIPQKESVEERFLYINMGTIYEEGIKDYKSALHYYNKSAVTSERLNDNDSIVMCVTFINIGTINGYLQEYDQALEKLNSALTIANKINDINNIIICYARIANVYDAMGDSISALTYNKKIIPLLSKMPDDWYYAGYKSEFLAQIGFSFYQNNDFQNGLNYCNEGYKLARSLKNYSRQKANCSCLYTIYNKTGRHLEALNFLQELIVINDTLSRRESGKNVQRIEFERRMLADSLEKVEEARFVREVHQEEIRKKEKTRNFSIVGGVLAIVLAGGFYSRWRFVHKSKKALQSEKDRSDNLLLNILPAEIADELKEKGRTDAREFDMVSVLFTDFKGFTQQSEKLSAADLVNEINYCFEAFDGIMETYSIEKIKTIGDAYMAVGGLPVPTDDSVKNTVLAALDMQAFMVKHKAEKEAKGEFAFEMRAGIHTGPVVAGIVGVKKFQYDIWGDTVNTASRMESHGEVGKVNLSHYTYEILKDQSEFEFESRGKIEVKGKGEIEMYFVSKT